MNITGNLWVDVVIIVVGLVFVTSVINNIVRKFWPTSGKGVVFIDEINRGNNAVMNAVFQLLTERSIGQYQLPEGWEGKMFTCRLKNAIYDRYNRRFSKELAGFRSGSIIYAMQFNSCIMARINQKIHSQPIQYLKKFKSYQSCY